MTQSARTPSHSTMTPRASKKILIASKETTTLTGNMHNLFHSGSLPMVAVNKPTAAPRPPSPPTAIIVQTEKPNTDLKKPELTASETIPFEIPFDARFECYISKAAMRVPVRVKGIKDIEPHLMDLYSILNLKPVGRPPVVCSPATKLPITELIVDDKLQTEIQTFFKDAFKKIPAVTKETSWMPTFGYENTIKRLTLGITKEEKENLSLQFLARNIKITGEGFPTYEPDPLPAPAEAKAPMPPQRIPLQPSCATVANNIIGTKALKTLSNSAAIGTSWAGQLITFSGISTLANLSATTSMMSTMTGSVFAVIDSIVNEHNYRKAFKNQAAYILESALSGLAFTNIQYAISENTTQSHSGANLIAAGTVLTAQLLRYCLFKKTASPAVQPLNAPNSGYHPFP